MKVRVSIILGMILSFWSGVVYATTFTVTNNLNEGEGSFRWAVEQSNAEEGNSKILQASNRRRLHFFPESLHCHNPHNTCLNLFKRFSINSYKDRFYY